VKQILSFLFFLTVISCKSQKTLLFKETALPNPTMAEKSVIAWNEQQPGFTELSQKEKEFYYWVNFSRRNPEAFYENAVLPMVKTYPQLKGKNLNSLEKDLKGLQPLTFFSLDVSLLKMSASHATDITSSDANPSHTSTNGDHFGDRFKKFGLKNCGGENISFAGGDADPLFMLVLLYLDINVDELGHRKALLNPSFIHTGISIKKYDNGNTFLVEDFACSQK
jgi:hypothetical protein